MKRHAKSLCNVIEDHYNRYSQIRGAEVGVWEGNLSSSLLGHFQQLELYMVDPWDEIERPAETMKQKEIGDIIAARDKALDVARRYPSRTFIYQMTSEVAANDLQAAGVQFDFVFIDANHLYESVKNDIAAWIPLVSPAGLLAGHDYNGVGDRRCGWGVKRAVDEAFGEGQVGVLPGNVWWTCKAFRKEAVK